jgi:hypothetical protein
MLRGLGDRGGALRVLCPWPQGRPVPSRSPMSYVRGCARLAQIYERHPRTDRTLSHRGGAVGLLAQYEWRASAIIPGSPNPPQRSAACSLDRALRAKAGTRVSLHNGRSTGGNTRARTRGVAGVCVSGFRSFGSLTSILTDFIRPSRPRTKHDEICARLEPREPTKPTICFAARART